MNTKTTLPISEARKKIFKIADEVQKPGNYYTFTEKGRPKAVLMSAEEFDSLMEDLEILGNPETMAEIKKAEEEIKRGEYITLDELKKELDYKDSSRPSFVAEKSKNLYGAKNKKIKKLKK